MMTADPSRTAWELHQQYDGPIADLEIRRPTLEDTYLEMVATELHPASTYCKEAS
ncbi:hypothetical protein [Streptomyces sp. SID685]|uniref:hypothetical protein n=1 Tax=Streptomyces sp. SID685 TaxID=2690322 RepID=UPI0031FE9735